MSLDLHNKIVVVTGGGSGIGRAMCQLFAAKGAKVIAADVNLAGAEETVASLEDSDFGQALSLDVTSPESWAEFRTILLANYGRIDVLCNNAGVTRMGKVGEFPLEEYYLQNKINIDGVVLGCHTFANDFRQQGSGHIINTASLAGLVALGSVSTYSATKFAVVGFTTSFAQEMAEHGVEVSVLCPSVVDTPMNDNLEFPGDEEADIMSPEEVAAYVVDAVEAHDGRLFVFTDPAYAEVVAQSLAAVNSAYETFVATANPGPDS